MGARATQKTPRVNPAGWRSPAHLNPRYTFGSYVVGATNRLAHAAARRVAVEPGAAYNPLFVHGSSGLGKTHLLHAIGHRVTQVLGATVHRTSGGALLEEFSRSVRRSAGSSFGNAYWQWNVLLVDDMHIFAGKDAVQAELVQMFARGLEEGRQVVVVSGESPGVTPVPEDWMYRQFDRGVIVKVEAPDLELRRAFVHRCAASTSTPVPEEVADILAVHLKRDIRLVEGAVVRVAAYAALEGRPATQALAWRVLGDLLPPENPRRRHLRPVPRDI